MIAASAAVMLAIAFVALAILRAAHLAAANIAAGTDLSAATATGANIAAAFGIELAAFVVGAFRIPARIAERAAIRAFALMAGCCGPNCVWAAMMMRL